MKRLICSAVREVAWQDVSLREPTAEEALVTNEFGTEKHGTMMAFYKGYANERGRWDSEARIHRADEGVLWNYPIPLGNTNVGRTESGERVFYSGGFQPQTVVNRARLWSLPEDIDWRAAMLLDPGEFALGAIRDGNVRAGDRVAVFGLGAIGLVTAQMAKIAGAEVVIGIDPVAHRRDVAHADHDIDPIGNDVGQILRDMCGGIGPDVIIDFSGSAPAFQSALRGIAYGGTIVCGAFPAPWGSGIDLGGEAHMNRPRVVFSRACSDPNPDHPRWDWARIQRAVHHLIITGRIDGSQIVDEPIAFESLIEAYPTIAENSERMIKLSTKY